MVKQTNTQQEEIMIYGKNDLGTLISQRVREAMASRRVGSSDLARLVHCDMGIKQCSATNFISCIRQGYTTHYLPRSSKELPDQDKKNLYRLSVVLDMLEIDKEDEVIQRLGRLYGSFFDYPPSNSFRTIEHPPLEEQLALLNLEDRRWVEDMVAKLIYNQ